MANSQIALRSTAGMRNFAQPSDPREAQECSKNDTNQCTDRTGLQLLLTISAKKTHFPMTLRACNEGVDFARAFP
jgi:hypothetical protein